MKIKEVVKEVLKNDFKARNNDKWLILKVLRQLGFKIYIDYKEMKNMPSFESITRARRYFQNELDLFCATSKIKRIREEKKQEYRSEYSKNK